MTTRAPAGRTVVTTRDERGVLDSLLERAGLEVLHVPLVSIGDAPDGGRALEDAMARLTPGDWLVVTSRHGARRAGPIAARLRGVQLAAVGTATADELARWAARPVDLVPDRQTASDLLDAMPHGTGRVVLAQTDLADGRLAAGLRELGHDVTAVTAYTTQLRAPTDAERRGALAADAVAFASGSAARSWATAIGTRTPPIVVAIGPTTDAAARAAGLQVTHVAADHSVDGLVAAITAALSAAP